MSEALGETIARAIRDAARDAHADVDTWLEAPGTTRAITPEQLVALLTSEAPWTERPPPYLARPWATAPHLVRVITEELTRHPDVSLRHLVRWLALVSSPALGERWLVHDAMQQWAQAKGPLDGLALASALDTEQLGTVGLLGALLDLGPDVEARTLLRAIEAAPRELAAALDGETSFPWNLLWSRASRRAQLLRALSTAPLPAELAELLLPYALNGARDLVPGLRRVLREVPVARLTALLTSARKEEREHAAEWLAERRDPAAVPALLAAMKKEKTDAVRAAIVGALEACGAPVPIDRAALEKDAAKLLARGWPAALAFLDRETLPTLRWKDGTEVARVVVEGWILAAHKAKDPEPSPLVRALAARMEPAGPRALARAILARFIAWDTRVPTDLSEQEEGILQDALAHWGKGKTREELLARPDAKNYGLAVRSAVSDKGVLGIVAALGGGELVPVLEGFVRTHRGFRASQSRAMLAVLSWIDDPRATQALLRFASRFRTPGIQKEARVLAEALAARRGWTMAELADRTVPTAGLDDDGTITLVYGRRAGNGEDAEIEETRRFVARLDESDALVLFDADGAPVKALPDARRDEDEAVVDEAKKRFSTARKELKTLFAAQRDRLHEAMLGERRWAVADFRTYFLEHPVLGRLARRTLFAAYDGDRMIATFRPAGDGSFVGVENDTVSVDERATIGLLHSSQIPRELDAAWTQHLGDYELLPLFPQLGRAAAPAERIEGRLVTAPERRPLLAVQVRSRAKRAGYSEQRGDGGIIDALTKSLPTLGRTLVVELEGIEPITDPKATASVLGIAIRDSGDPRFGGADLSWSEVSAVLRDEAWGDLLSIVD